MSDHHRRLTQVPEHDPALFNATGWSHHPYHLTVAPNVPSPKVDADWVTLGDLPELERALNQTQLVYGSHKKFPVYLTEYGFNTNPPQRGNAISLGAQASYLNQAEYLTWRDPRVRTLTQYLLQDSAQIDSVFSAFASGLIFANGAPKPSFGAYRLPLWMPTVRPNAGRRSRSGGASAPRIRDPDTGQAQTAQVQFQPGSSGSFMWFSTVTIRTANSCYFNLT